MSVAVEARELSRRFGDFVAVDAVSFTVGQGEILGFLGSNGAGKTTTIRMLCGLLRPSSGEARVLGMDLSTQSRELRSRLGYMSQKFSLYTDLSVEENLRFWGAAYKIPARQLRAKIENAVVSANLGEHRTSLVRDLPLGFRQRLALAAALLHEPELVFLDEPTAGVDPEARRQFWRIITGLSSKGVTVFVTTHAMDEAERCHRVALMHAGKILAMDAVEELLKLIPEGQLVKLESANLGPLLQQLRTHPLVLEAAPFANAAHVLLKAPGSLPQLLADLRITSGGIAKVEIIGPTLEDVFVFVIGQHARDRR